jgi:hypothetical protein
MHTPREGSDDDTHSLRELVDDELLELFSSNERMAQAAVRHLIRDADGDPTIEERCLDMLENSLEHSNDDTSATVWSVVILGELLSLRAIPYLLEGLRRSEDELLEDASRVAILRIGSPAVLAVMDALDEDEENAAGTDFLRTVYDLLGTVGCLQDPALRVRVIEFLQSRVLVECARAPGNRAIEALFSATARLGDRGQIAVMKRVLRQDYRGRNADIQDSIEILEENTTGLPIVASPPWMDRYGWLFEDEAERSRVHRPQRLPSEDEGDLEEAPDEED